MKRIIDTEKEPSWAVVRDIPVGSTFSRDGGETIYLRGQVVINDTFYATLLTTGFVETLSGNVAVEPCEFVFMEEKLVIKFGISRTRVQ